MSVSVNVRQVLRCDPPKSGNFQQVPSARLDFFRLELSDIATLLLHG